MGANHLDVEVLIADIGVHLVKGAARVEDRERGCERNQSAARHAGRHAVHVLLSDAQVVEAIRE